jgi:hypothetical protein
MKKALVIALMFGLGLGLVAFGQSSIEGKWSFSVEFNPGAVVFADFLTDFDSTLSLSYLFGGWTFSSETGFDGLGYASQSFAAEGVLGAFSFSSSMVFLPRAITASDVFHDFGGNFYEDTGVIPNWLLAPVTDTITTVDTIGVAFDEWTVEAQVNIAGVSFSGLFYMKNFPGTTTSVTNDIYEYEYTIVTGTVIPSDLIDITPVAVPPLGPGTEIMIQTGTYTVVDATGLVTVGAGWRFLLEGSVGDVTLKSYTYLNLDEGFAETATVKSFDRDGAYVIMFADQVVRFSSQYFVIEGLSLGCIEADAALLVTCANGFERFSLWFKDIYLLCCGISTDLEIDFGLATKTVQLFPSITVDATCFIPTLSLNWDDETITGISLDALEVEVALNGLTFSSKTAWDGSMGTLDSGNTEDWYFLVPAVAALGTIPAVNAAGAGLYIVDHVSFANDYFELFESFTIKYEADSCCGGALSIEIETQFGNRFTETLAEYGYWYETNVNGAAVAGAAADHGQGLYYDVFAASGGVAPALTGYGPGAMPAVWYPGCGANPALPVDVAYSQLIGVGALPPVVYVAGTAVETIFSGSSTLKTAVAGGTLFGWAQTAIDVEMGIGSNLSLTFGLNVGAYGWTQAALGFSVTF